MEGIAKKTDEIMSFFGSNPFSTPVGQKIEQATDSTLASENWGLNMEICDMVNMSEEGPKDAVRAIRKRFQQSAGKNYTVIMYTLTVLETCVKNCGRRFQVLVCQKDFVQELVKLIGPKNDPPPVVHEKILGLIQTWADTFKSEPDMIGVVQIHHDLKAKGVEFPMTDLDTMAPILTPKRTVETEPILHPVDLGERPIRVNVDQMAKVKKDLDIVQSNMSVFSEMLSEMKPGQENPQDLELLQELFSTCKEMQRRIAELLCSISNDELTAEMLHINDELNNLFLRYGRYRKNQEKTGTTPLQNQKTLPGMPSQEKEPSLIDFGAEPPKNITSKMGGLSVKEDADFDSFAQSRTSDKAKPSLSAAAIVKDFEEDIMQSHRQSDFDEMEAWLEANPEGAVGGQEASMTSTEFEKFLSERAAASENSASGGSKNATKEK